jgi:hypothetical protein
MYRAGRAATIAVTPAPGEPSGTLRGRVVDASGSVLPGVTVAVRSGDVQLSAVTRGDGTFMLRGVPPGQVMVTTALSGFFPQATTFDSTGAAQHVEAVLQVAAIAETVTVAAASPAVQTNEPSENVVNLQRRAAGVLPIPIDVPRAGSSHRFARPLVLDDETTVRFKYARR